MLEESKLLDGFRLFLRAERGLSRNTVDSYVRDVREFVSCLKKKGKDVLSADYADIMDFLQSHVVLYKTSSVARKISSIKNFFKYLMIENLIQEDPSSLIESPKVVRGLPRVLSEEEIAKIIESASGTTPLSIRDRAILEFAYATGARESEIIEVSLHDIDLDEGFVFLRGKGEKVRLVPIGSKATEALHRYLKVRNTFSPRVDNLFVSRRGGRLSRMSIWRIFAKYSRKAGIDDVHPHTFRHSFATHMHSRGADLRIVQELLGHASIKTTQIYTHLQKERLRRIHSRYHPRG